MASKMQDAELCEFYARYGHVISEEIRELCKIEETVLSRGTVPYLREVPDLDPEITECLARLQDSFDPRSITAEQLEEVVINNNIFEPMLAKLKNICFLAKTWVLPYSTRCFQCKTKIESKHQNSFWLKCIECSTFWCLKCYDVNQAREDNHKALLNKTACAAPLKHKDGVTRKCGLKFNSTHLRWKNPWAKCSRCLEWRCSTCFIARLGPCECTGIQRVMPKFYDHPCVSGKNFAFIIV